MNLVFLDFETFYSSGPDGLSLRTSTYHEYCHDNRLETIGVGLAIGTADPVWITGNDVAPALNAINWSETAVVCHNALFDGAILNYIYGIYPVHIFCTMSLAAAAGLRMAAGGSLGGLSDYLNERGFFMPHKGTEVLKADGKHLADFTVSELSAYGEYCKDDVRICRAIFDLMIDALPPAELPWQSLALKCGTQPALLVDRPLLEAELVRIATQKAESLNRAATARGCTPLQFQAILASNPKFSKLLEDNGCPVPTKVSKTTGRVAPALAKTDEELLELLEHPNPDIIAFVAARLGNKSTNAELQIQRMIDMGNRPIAFSYNVHGAHTGRLSATQKWNCMALSSGRVAGTSNAARRALYAQPGYLVGAVDSNQVELRVGAYIADEAVMIDIFAEGRDPYSELAETMFQVPAKEVKALAKVGNPEGVKMRAAGKAGTLGAIFGAGPAGYHTYARSQAKLNITLGEAKSTVEAFRSKYPRYPAFWRQCDNMLKHMIVGGRGRFGGPDGQLFEYDGQRTLFGEPTPGIRLPDGIWINYPNLREIPNDDPNAFSATRMVYDQSKGKFKSMMGIYGSRCFENLVQGTAFAAMKGQMLAINNRYRVVANVHDEAVVIVPETEATEATQFLEYCFSIPPVWAPALKLKGEAGVAARYGDI